MSTIARFACCVLGSAVLAGCASVFGPRALEQTRVPYNEVVKTSSEEQLLLNIVRLRYGDTPSSLQISSIAAQFEQTQSGALIPFLSSAGGDINRSFIAVLPQLQVQGADRPTFSFTPMDDAEFTRKLFTPMTLDGILYLAKTTWPISTVFRLYLENLNWVSNAQTGSGPTPDEPPDYADFLRGIQALQKLQDRNQIVFGTEEKIEQLGDPVPAGSVSAKDLIEAAKNNYEYRKSEKGQWVLVKKSQQPVLRVDPQALNTPEMRELAHTFRIKPGLKEYPITEEALTPFASTFPPGGVTNFDLETRSLLQALYFVSQGIEIPAEHVSQRILTTTRDPAGQPFDWQQVTGGLFKVHSAKAGERPPRAHVAIAYRGYWFYIDETDQDSKSTFSLLMELARLELAGQNSAGPQLTLPLGGR